MMVKKTKGAAFSTVMGKIRPSPVMGNIKPGMDVSGAGLAPGAKIGGVITNAGLTEAKVSSRPARPTTGAERAARKHEVMMLRLRGDLVAFRSHLRRCGPMDAQAPEYSAMLGHVASLLALIAAVEGVVP